MTPILAKVTAIEKRGDQYQVIVQISPKTAVMTTIYHWSRKVIV